MTEEAKELNLNRIWDLILFAMAGGLIGGFMAVGMHDASADLAKVLFGAFLMGAGRRK